jgi:hypothetical protein
VAERIPQHRRSLGDIGSNPSSAECAVLCKDILSPDTSFENRFHAFRFVISAFNKFPRAFSSRRCAALWSVKLIDIAVADWNELPAEQLDPLRSSLATHLMNHANDKKVLPHLARGMAALALQMNEWQGFIPGAYYDSCGACFPREFR